MQPSAISNGSLASYKGLQDSLLGSLMSFHCWVKSRTGRVTSPRRARYMKNPSQLRNKQGSAWPICGHTWPHGPY